MTHNIQATLAETSAARRVTFDSFPPDERLNSRQVALTKDHAGGPATLMGAALDALVAP